MQQVSDSETKTILELAEHQLGAPGDFVELGCYKGDTSVLLQKMLVKNGFASRLWIYDSFEGLPEKTSEDQSVAGDEFKKGELLVTKREVVEKFKKAGLVLPRIKKGFFDQLPEDAFPEKIAFAFLDGDLYGSIKTSLKIVEPRVTKDSVILVHDYNNPQLPGVARAVDEWLGGRKITVKDTVAIIKL
jgi:O-methyltransferase